VARIVFINTKCLFNNFTLYKGNQTRGGKYSLPGNWAPWSSCSTTCGIGHVIRHRSCAARPPVVIVNSKFDMTAGLNETATCANILSCSGLISCSIVNI
jgi:hypothetical protein